MRPLPLLPVVPLVRGVAAVLIAVLAQSASAGNDCDAPPASWQPRDAVQALAERSGWRIDKLKIDDGCYEIKGRDADGRRFKAKIDPATLQVIGIKRDDGSHRHEREREREREGPPPPAPASGPRSSAGPAAVTPAEA